MKLILHQMACWLNMAVILLFFCMEVYWFIRQRRVWIDVPYLLLVFFIANLSFLLLYVSMHYQQIPLLWFGIMRILFLAIFGSVGFLLHYHGGGGGAIATTTGLFVIISIVTVIVVEGSIWLYHTYFLQVQPAVLVNYL